MPTSAKLPRPEHPRPQFQRAAWLNLNGRWTFELDPGQSGQERGLAASQGFDRSIQVPFCPESGLSGVAHTDFITALWYHRTFRVPAAWAGQRVLLHFGAVDYDCQVFVDGQLAGRHWGGSSSFELDLTALVRPGRQHHLVVAVRDDVRSGQQPGGKQSPNYKSAGCHYTRTTGIWQTVWLEAVADGGLASCRVVPDLDGARFLLTPRFRSVRQGLTFEAVLKAGKTVVATARQPAADGVSCELRIAKPRAWSPEDPFLYDLELRVCDGKQLLDSVASYAGLRKVHCEGNRLRLNNQPIYLRLVLDQGFYPDGIWTAPTDAALKRDIELSMNAGFNGARLHQKVFEERFHYWADRLGYLTWGEFPSWGSNAFASQGNGVAGANFLHEWREVVMRDLNHPSIIAWTPLNETGWAPDWELHRKMHQELYDLTRDLDPTRPVNETSGYVHVKTDLWTVHNYEQDPGKLKAQLALNAKGEVWRNFPDREVPYTGQPYLVDEFGGIKWIPPDRRPFADNSWGYGDAPKTLAAFYARLQGQFEALRAVDHLCGFCYTQLTDVEQEQNGIYFYDRNAKFDMRRVRRIIRGE